MSMQSSTAATPIALIGFGEAAQAFVQGWRVEAFSRDVASYDAKTETQNEAAPAKWRDYKTHGVTGQADLAQLLAQTDTVFSLVTADQAQIAAHEAAKTITSGTFYFDGNSCAPKTKQACAHLIEAAGGHYIDMAIMAPVHPKLHKTPVLISGNRADEALKRLSGLGMLARIEPGPVGRASTIKMLRSVMVKGMEALMAECLLAARRAGVEDVVLNSLEQSWPEFGFSKRATYNLERMMVHGPRRAAEMREVAKTIADLGLANGMSAATADWQQLIGDMELAAGETDLVARLDTILEQDERGKL